MKKSLVLAMAMALGVTASAYAANPFSDVPAGHWAYDSVAKLAAAGVVEGYADGAFAGDKLITRYEMAQITAKAMAKGANVDKLAAEFADELDTLGVRVAKLEKGADAVKITGQVRARYQSHDSGDGDKGDLRTRFWIAGQVNDDWTYTAMIQNQQEFNNDKEDGDTKLKRAYVDGKIGGLAVHAGRWDEVTSSGAIFDMYLDGVKVSYGKDVKVWALIGEGADQGVEEVKGDVVIAGLETTIGVVDAYANYFKADSAYLSGAGLDDDGNRKGAVVFGDKEVYNVGLNLDVAKDLNLSYEYMWGDKKYNKEVSKDGYIVGLNYKGADAATAGSYGLHAYYYDQPVNAIYSPTFDLTSFMNEGGYEGWSVGVDYTLAKNMQLCVNYYDTEAKTTNSDDQTIFTELYLFF